MQKRFKRAQKSFGVCPSDPSDGKPEPLGTEHSENKIIVQSCVLENEVEPGVLQCSRQQTVIFQECKSNMAEATEGVLVIWHS